MDVKQTETRNPKDNFLEAQFRAKQLVEHEKEEKEKQASKVISFFKESKKRDLFENEASLVKNYEKHIGPSIDFSYYKINLEFLKKSGINLEKIDDRVIVSDSGARMAYDVYYLDRKNKCIIWVKHHFKHVRIYSDNGKNDLMTYTFVNSRNEIFYYDIWSGKVLIKKCSAGMNASHAKDLLNGKAFKIEPSCERNYELLTNGVWETKSIADIHLLPQTLLDILLEHYKCDSVPSTSEMQIKTELFSTFEPTTVQNTVKINYKYSGTIQTTEKLLGYEITMYFKNIPDRKVKARFYLTESEKNQEMVLTDDLLEKITLEDVKEKFERNSNFCEFYYKKYFINKENSKKKNPSLKNLVEVFSKNMKIKGTFVEFSQLADTYKGICLEYFTIDDSGIQSNIPFCKQIRENKLEYDGTYFKQRTMYAVLHDDQLYLVEIYVNYVSYTFMNHSIVLRFPAFGIKDINIDIFKPTDSSEVDIFVGNIQGKELNRRTTEFNIFSNGENIKREHYFGRNNWNKFFPNFIIKTNGKRESYKAVDVDSGTIYKKILDCIKTLRTETSKFNFSTFYPFGYDDDDVEKTKIPFYSGTLEYGHYFDDGFNRLSVNSPLKEKCDYTYSSGDELFSVVFDSDVPYYKTTFYALLGSYNCLNRSTEIKDTQYLSLSNCKFWTECIKYLIHIQNEKIFE